MLKISFLTLLIGIISSSLLANNVELECGTFKAIGRVLERDKKISLVIFEKTNSETVFKIKSNSKRIILRGYLNSLVMSDLRVTHRPSLYKGQAEIVGIQRAIPDPLARNSGEGLWLKKKGTCQKP